MKQPESLPQKTLLLSGFMATGKTTVGRLLAQKLGIPFVDLDEAVEQEAGCSIPIIFSDRGETAFRTLEREALHRELLKPSPRIIALGGGTVVDPTLRAFALKHGHIITLTATPETAEERLGASHTRPLLTSHPDRLGKAQELLQHRKAAYAETHATIQTDGKSPEQVAAEVEAAWNEPTLVVPLGLRSYPVRLTEHPARVVAEIAQHQNPSSLFLITDKTVDALYAGSFHSALAQHVPYPIHKIVIPEGEEQKSLHTLEAIAKQLMLHGADRASLLIALGGGVVSDLTGLVAALYHRGIPWIAIPTTLLSMVDAAVGGKTAVNLGQSKNILGAFHQPSAVLIHPPFSNSESDRAYRGGLAEVVKSAAIGDPTLIQILHENTNQVLSRDPHILREIVLRAAQVKTQIVTQDERETGIRAHLNFGHTLGHSLESLAGLHRLTHGEAISLGMIAALQIGQSLHITKPKDAEVLQHLLNTMGLPTDLSQEPLDQAIRHTTHDKKHIHQKLRFILLKQFGQMQVHPLTVEELETILLGT